MKTSEWKRPKEGARGENESSVARRKNALEAKTKAASPSERMRKRRKRKQRRRKKAQDAKAKAASPKECAKGKSSVDRNIQHE
jgi:hypothetical protein